MGPAWEQRIRPSVTESVIESVIELMIQSTKHH